MLLTRAAVRRSWRNLIGVLALVAAAPASAATLDGACSSAPDALSSLTAELEAVGTSTSHDTPPAVTAFLGGKAEWLGDGWTCRTWGNDDWVVKVVYADVPEQNARANDRAKRQAIVDYSIWVVDKLRSSSRFTAWRDRVPPLATGGPFTLVQPRANGIWFDRLSPAAQKVAEAENAAILAAAVQALPGVEFDLNVWNPRNAFYDEQGHLVSWFDPAGAGSWVPGWHVGDPLVRSFWDRASTLIHQRIDGTAFRAVDQKVRMGGSYGKRVEGGDLAFGHGLVIANLDPSVGRAFVVKNGFRMAYESTDRPDLGGRPLGEALGAPLDEEHWDADHVVQHFENGWMTWNQAEGVRVQLTP